jgi:DnaA family protein
MPIQLSLMLQLPDCTTFANFYATENLSVVKYLQEWLFNESDSCLYLTGTRGVGLTHLLQACCHEINAGGQAAAYLPMLKKNLSVEILEGMESLALIALDDVDAIAGNRAWEEALFHCYNRCRVSGTKFLLSSHSPPAQISWNLPDLASRLNASILLSIKALSDVEKVEALQKRAHLRGLDLALEVGNYLLNHLPRNMTILCEALDKLDQAAYVAQRRLTIPFIKEVLRL